MIRLIKTDFILLKKIILTSHEPQGQKCRVCVFKEHKVPFYKEKVRTDELELFEFTAIAPDDTARIILEKMSKILDTRQKEVMVTSQTLDAAFSDYLMNLEQQEESKNTGRLAEEFHAIAEPSVEFNKKFACNGDNCFSCCSGWFVHR